tara:strand:- start:443 stop:592 length:150 start_codon:yes stop_codon:yes gene_type:complete
MNLDKVDNELVNKLPLKVVVKCNCELKTHERAKMELDYNKCMDCEKQIK